MSKEHTIDVGSKSPSEMTCPGFQSQVSQPRSGDRICWVLPSISRAPTVCQALLHALGTQGIGDVWCGPLPSCQRPLQPPPPQATPTWVCSSKRIPLALLLCMSLKLDFTAERKTHGLPEPCLPHQPRQRQGHSPELHLQDASGTDRSLQLLGWSKLLRKGRLPLGTTTPSFGVPLAFPV